MVVLYLVSGDLWGGAEAQVCMQICALRQAQWDIQVLLFNEGEVSRRFEEQGIPCAIVSEQQGGWSFFRSALRKIRDISPDIVVSHGYKEAYVAALSASGSSRKWIACFHGLMEQTQGYKLWKVWCYLTLERVLARYFASRIITISHMLSKDLRLAEHPKLAVVHNVYAPSGGAKGVPEDLPVDTPTIAIVGRLMQVKRVDRAIAAHALLVRQCVEQGQAVPQLLIVGDGPLRPQLEAQIRDEQLEEHVQLLGYRADAADIIAYADVLLLTSEHEGIPTVLLEAIAAVTPVVSTNVGGIPEVASLIKDYPMRLVEKKDTDALVAALAEILSIEVTEQQRAQVRRDYSEYFTPEVAAKKLGAIFQKTLA